MAKQTPALTWWVNATQKIVGLPVGRARVAATGHTRLVLHKLRGDKGQAIALDVAGHDLSELAHTDAGRWIIAQQASLATADIPRHWRWAKRFQYILFIAAAFAALTAVARAAQWGWAAAVFAAVLTAGGGWLARERWHAHVKMTCAADQEATEQYGPDAARTALQAAPRLYRSVIHEWVERRNPASTASRLARLPAS